MKWIEDDSNYRLLGTVTSLLASIPVVVGYSKERIRAMSYSKARSVPAAHDFFIITPADWAGGQIDSTLWDDPAVEIVIFHRMEDVGWDAIRRIIEYELRLRGFQEAQTNP